MRKLAFTLVLLSLLGCDRGPGVVDPSPASFRPSFASAPTAVPFSVTFDDVNPCTGLIHTVTISGTEYVHEYDGRVVVRGDRTISTTPTGFEGRGEHSFVANGPIVTFQLNDILTNASGDKIRAHFVFVLDVATSSVQVEKGTLTCVGT